MVKLFTRGIEIIFTALHESEFPSKAKLLERIHRVNILPVAVAIIVGAFRISRKNFHAAFNGTTTRLHFAKYNTDTARPGNKRRKYVSAEEVRGLNAPRNIPRKLNLQ